jgi:hypothetical protein
MNLESLTYDENKFIEVIGDHPTYLSRFIGEERTRAAFQFSKTCFN